MIGQSVTITRERPDQQRTYTTHGTVTDVNRDDTDRVHGVLVKGTREDGTHVHGWYAVGPGGLDGSLVTAQHATVDACGHDVHRCRCTTS